MKRDDLDRILDHTVYKQGPGPNGSGGEWEVWDKGKTTTLKTELNRWREAYADKARVDGAKAYNVVLTNNLGKCEYTEIDGGMAGVYRQEIVGEAIREANRQTIQLGKPTALRKQQGGLERQSDEK